MSKLTNKLPLTEVTFYILLTLRTAKHGYGVMQEVENLSNGRVIIASGTMYGAIELLLKQNLISSIPSEHARRKMYQITDAGLELLALEVERLHHLIAIYNV